MTDTPEPSIKDDFELMYAMAGEATIQFKNAAQIAEAIARVGLACGALVAEEEPKRRVRLAETASAEPVAANGKRKR